MGLGLLNARIDEGPNRDYSDCKLVDCALGNCEEQCI